MIDAIILLKKQKQLNKFHFSIVGHENKTGYIKKLKEKLKKSNVLLENISFLGRVIKVLIEFMQIMMYILYHLY